jgi:putative ABC transport system permease protein
MKQVLRHRVRSVLTIAGIGAGIFLFTAVQTMQNSLSTVIGNKAEENTLIVYRENRFCPMTSRLPEHYLNEIQGIAGVTAAIPILIAVNNCGASLDVITFRGVPKAELIQYNPAISFVEGSLDLWRARGDAALVGEHFAKRRSLSIGDTFEAAGVRVSIAGVIRSPMAQDNNVAYVSLPFLQQSTPLGLGVVTQFNVKVKNIDQLEKIAASIDLRFASDSAPTTTHSEKAFFAQTAKDMIEMIHFTRWIGLGSVMAVFGLIANSLLLAARGRIREGAILQTVGFSRILVAFIMLFEGMILGLIGGILGSSGATLFFHLQRYTIGNEGLTLALLPDLGVLISGFIVTLILGLGASIWPAILVSNRPLVDSLK